MGDGMNIMMGNGDDEYSNDSPNNNSYDEYSETTGGMRGLQKEFQRNEDDYSYSTTDSEEQRQERVRQIRQQDLDNYRRHRDVGGNRELELKQKLSQFEEDIGPLSGAAAPDFVYHGPNPALPEVPAEDKNDYFKKMFEKAQEQAQTAIRKAWSGHESAHEEEETEEGESTYTGNSDDEEEEDDFAEQLVHEMMQLLHHSRKNRNEAERLIEYKRAFIRQRHETNPELDHHIQKNANYKKLECSAQRFVRHLKDGDVPRTEQTLSMERELLQNVAAMRDIRRESDELDMEYESMIDAAE